MRRLCTSSMPRPGAAEASWAEPAAHERATPKMALRRDIDLNWSDSASASCRTAWQWGQREPSGEVSFGELGCWVYCKCEYRARMVRESMFRRATTTSWRS